MTIRPSTHAERFFFYAQSTQISAQTGLIGHLRGDFGTSGNQFFHTFFDCNMHLKSERFRQEFDQVINALRDNEEFGGILKNRSSMFSYCANTATQENTLNDYPHYGYRVDTEAYSYLIRCFPGKGDYNLYVHCHLKAMLDSHLANAKKGIRFIDTHYNEKFRVADGSKVRLITAAGENRDMTIRYINDYHFEAYSKQGNSFWHICEFAEWFEKNECRDIFPLPSSEEGMTREEFIALIGKDLVVDYPFGKELQRWSLKNFYVGDDGQIRHKRLNMLTDGFISKARNPHWGEPTHG